MFLSLNFCVLVFLGASFPEFLKGQSTRSPSTLIRSLRRFAFSPGLPASPPHVPFSGSYSHSNNNPLIHSVPGSAAPSQKYSSRTNRGEVVTTFGSVQGVSWSGRGGSGSVSLKVIGDPEPLTSSYKSMFQKLSDIREGNWFPLGRLGGFKAHGRTERSEVTKPGSAGSL